MKPEYITSNTRTINRPRPHSLAIGAWPLIGTFSLSAALYFPVLASRAQPLEPAEHSLTKRVAVAQPIPGQYIAVFEPNVAKPVEAARGLGNQFGLEVRHVYQHSVRGFAFAGPEQAANALARNPTIAYVEADQWTTSGQVSIPSGIGRVGINESLLNEIAPPGQNVDARIAIIDTGLDRNHPDLNIDPDGVRFYLKTTRVKGQNVSEIVSDAQWDDYEGHGTHVGGTAAANGQIVGVAPGALLTSVKVMGTNASTTSTVIAGVDWVAARADRFDVANMSVGGGYSQAMNDAVRAATERGIVFAVAAMNNGTNAAMFSPASEPTAITVSAMTDFDGSPGALSSEPRTTVLCNDPIFDDTFACFSNWGSPVDICAPGVKILSASLNGGYAIRSGTSMAAPHVAGAAALYVARNRAALSALTGSARVAHVTDAITSRAWLQGDYGYFSGDKDGVAEPLLNIPALLGAERPNFAVAISAPANGSEFDSGATITFTATATVNSEDWTDSIVWTSSIDGHLSSQPGGSIVATLSDGAHTITASVTDAGTFFSGWDAITIVVGDVVEPPPPVQLFVRVSTDKSEYINGETMRSFFRVTENVENGPPVEGATVQVEMRDPKGALWTTSGNTDAAGLFEATWKVNVGKAGKGTYTITGTATKTGYLPGQGSTTFVVK